MHGVSADHQHLGTGVLQTPRCPGHHRRGTVPVAGLLECCDLGDEGRLADTVVTTAADGQVGAEIVVVRQTVIQNSDAERTGRHWTAVLMV